MRMSKPFRAANVFLALFGLACSLGILVVKPRTVGEFSPCAQRMFMASYAAISKEELLIEMDLGVVGTVTSMKSHFEKRDGHDCRPIYTVIEVEIEEVLFSRAGSKPKKVAFSIMGGKVDDEELINADIFPYQVGQRNVLFLAGTEDPYRHGADYGIWDMTRYVVQADGTLGGGDLEKSALRMIWGHETMTLQEMKSQF